MQRKTLIPAACLKFYDFFFLCAIAKITIPKRITAAAPPQIQIMAVLPRKSSESPTALAVCNAGEGVAVEVFGEAVADIVENAVGSGVSAGIEAVETGADGASVGIETTGISNSTGSAKIVHFCATSKITAKYLPGEP